MIGLFYGAIHVPIEGSDTLFLVCATLRLFATTAMDIFMARCGPGPVPCALRRWMQQADRTAVGYFRGGRRDNCRRGYCGPPQRPSEREDRPCNFSGGLLL